MAAKVRNGRGKGKRLEMIENLAQAKKEIDFAETFFIGSITIFITKIATTFRSMLIS